MGVGEPPGAERLLGDPSLGGVVVDRIAMVAAEGDDEEARQPVELDQARQHSATVEQPRVLDQHRAAPAGQVGAARDRDRLLLPGHVDGAQARRAPHALHQPADPGVRHRGHQRDPAGFEPGHDLLHARHRPASPGAGLSRMNAVGDRCSRRAWPAASAAGTGSGTNTSSRCPPPISTVTSVCRPW